MVLTLNKVFPILSCGYNSWFGDKTIERRSGTANLQAIRDRTADFQRIPSDDEPPGIDAESQRATQMHVDHMAYARSEVSDFNWSMHMTLGMPRSLWQILDRSSVAVKGDSGIACRKGLRHAYSRASLLLYICIIKLHLGTRGQPDYEAVGDVVTDVPPSFYLLSCQRD